MYETEKKFTVDVTGFTLSVTVSAFMTFVVTSLRFSLKLGWHTISVSLLLSIARAMAVALVDILTVLARTENK